jgi:N-methylhydantoinase A/oxoprolinase/acetone carboxylase beta subunit
LVEAQERINPAGEILMALDTSKLRADLSSAREAARGDTTVLNAYLAPPLRRYVTGLQRELRNLDPGGRPAD